MESRASVALDYDAEPSVTVYTPQAVLGRYRFLRHEGTADQILQRGKRWGIRTPTLSPSSRQVVEPFGADEIVIRPVYDDLALVAFGGDDQTVAFEFVSGSWEGVARGEFAELRLAEESVERWETAMHTRFEDLLEDYRAQTVRTLEGRPHSVSACRTFDVTVPRPRIEIDYEQLQVSVGAARFGGEFLVSSWHTSIEPPPERAPLTSFRWGLLAAAILFAMGAR